MSTNKLKTDIVYDIKVNGAASAASQLDKVAASDEHVAKASNDATASVSKQAQWQDKNAVTSDKLAKALTNTLTKLKKSNSMLLNVNKALKQNASSFDFSALKTQTMESMLRSLTPALRKSYKEFVDYSRQQLGTSKTTSAVRRAVLEYFVALNTLYPAQVRSASADKMTAAEASLLAKALKTKAAVAVSNAKAEQIASKTSSDAAQSAAQTAQIKAKTKAMAADTEAKAALNAAKIEMLANKKSSDSAVASARIEQIRAKAAADVAQRASQAKQSADITAAQVALAAAKTEQAASAKAQQAAKTAADIAVKAARQAAISSEAEGKASVYAAKAADTLAHAELNRAKADTQAAVTSRELLSADTQRATTEYVLMKAEEAKSKANLNAARTAETLRRTEQSLNSELLLQIADFGRLYTALGRIASMYMTVISPVKKLFEVSSEFAEANHLLYATLASSMDDAADATKKVAIEITTLTGDTLTETITATEETADKIQSLVTELNSLANSRGLDPTSFIRTYATFYQMANAAGMAQESIEVLAEGLTELSYDTASLYDVDFESVAYAFRSALGGVSTAVKKYGVDVSRSAADSYLLAHGIDAQYNSLSRADKMLLMYLLLMEGSDTAWDDLAKSIDQPANKLRLLQEQLRIAARTFGSVVLPLFMPFIDAAQLAANALISFSKTLSSFLSSIFGSSYDEAVQGWNTYLAGVSTASDGVETLDEDVSSLADSTESAADAAEQLKNALMGFDEINNITINDTTSSGGSSGASDSAADTSVLNELIQQVAKLWDDASKYLVDSLNGEFGQKFIQGFTAIFKQIWTVNFLKVFGKAMSSAEIGSKIAAIGSRVSAALKSVFSGNKVIEAVAKFASKAAATIATPFKAIGTAVSKATAPITMPVKLGKFVPDTDTFEKFVKSGQKWAPAGESMAAKGAVPTKASMAIAAAAPNTNVTALETLGKLVPKLEPLTTALTKIKSAFSGIGEVVKTVASGFGEAIKVASGFTGLTEIFSKVSGFVGPLATIFGFVSVLANIPSYIEAISTNTMTMGQVLADAILTFTGLDFIVDLVNELASGTTDLSPVFNNISSMLLEFLATLIPTIIGALANLPSALLNLAGQLLPAVGTLVGGLVEAALNLLKTGIGGFFENPTSFLTWGGDLIAGVLQGIVAAVVGIGEFFWNAIAVPFMNVFGIASPSKKFEEFGNWIIEGLINGIKLLIAGIAEIVSAPFLLAQAAISLIPGAICTAFSGLGEALKVVLEGVSDFLEDPFGTAAEAIKGIASSIVGFFKDVPEKIAGFFTNLNISFPVKLPHFTFGTIPIDDAPILQIVKDALKLFGVTEAPSIGVEWYAKGTILDSATLIGAGEAGPEAILPLHGAAMQPFAEAVASYLPTSRVEVSVESETISDSKEQCQLLKLQNQLLTKLVNKELVVNYDSKKASKAINRASRANGTPLIYA